MTVSTSDNHQPETVENKLMSPEETPRDQTQLRKVSNLGSIDSTN
ncbi:10356_t:CDS:1, partial [Ambispora gerdemannii]